MNKLKITGLVLTVLFLAGCSTAKKAEQSQDPTQKQNGYLRDMVGIKNQAEQNIKVAQEAENERLKTTLNEGNNQSSNNMDYVKKYSGAVLNTNLGKIKVKFYNEDSPVTVNNFLKLALEKFYNGTKFHRVIKGFMIQGGDPNSKDDDWTNDGQGGPGYSFKDEFNARKLVKGSLAMANSGPNTNGSQFFIVTAATTPWLDGKHTNFGEVTEGIDVLDKIESVNVNANSHPTEDVTIQSIELIAK